MLHMYRMPTYLSQLTSLNLPLSKESDIKKKRPKMSTELKTVEKVVVMSLYIINVASGDMCSGRYVRTVRVL